MHTPGPWAIDDQVPGREVGYRAIVAGTTPTREGGEIIAYPSPMGEDNARLIVNAPALLDALRDVLVDLIDSDFSDDFADTIETARAAIEAATGEDLSTLPRGALECRVTSDGYRLYRIASGEWVDDVRPEWRDLAFDAFPDGVSDEARSFGPWGQR